MILLFVFIISLLILVWYKKDNKLPPGPFSLPIVGYYPFVGSDPLVKIQKISDNYGPIMRLNLLGEDFYFLNNFEAVNEALKNQGETFSGRASMEFSILNELHGTKGIQNSEGEQWKFQQKFYIGKLSGLGMGKSDFSLKIHELCDDLIGYIKEREEMTDLSLYLSNFTSNVISLLLINKKYSPSDPLYTDLTKNIECLNICGSDLNFYISGPITYLLLRAKRKLWNTFYDRRRKVFELILNRIKDRIDNNDGSECEDILDYCIQERNGPNAEFFDENTLLINFYLMFVAGTDTTSSTLNFGCYLMANNRDIQQKVYQEILDTFGNEYRVLPTDIEKLNYTRAVIDEIQRFTCVVPFGLVHSNRKPATICGYHLPKRSKIIANILKLSRDNRYFKNPNVFDPNNFLDENGNYTPNEALIPFGIGKRKCLGKKLAEMELFIGFTRLIQQFEWLPPRNGIMKFEIHERLVRHLSPFKIIAKQRIY